MDETANVARPPADPLGALRAQVASLNVLLAEFRQRDDHLRNAMQASNVVAYQWDIARDRVTRLRSSNAPGTSLEDAGTFESVVAKVLPEDQQRFRADIAAALSSPDGLYRTELRYQRPDGEIRWISESGRVLRSETGLPSYMVGITFDITDRKHVEEALARADAQLREEAERKDEFLAILAHELRNPLAPIRNAVQILRRIGPDARTGETACDIIDRQVGQLVRLVDDLLDVSRISRGKIVMQQQTIDLREVARHALDTSHLLLSAREHEVRVALHDEPVQVVGDPVRLAQVITNLLNNAAKYTDPGGRVELSVTSDGADAMVAVSDNGRGLDAAVRLRVFEKFYQVDRDLDCSQGGLGLGLSLVKRLVELHGGGVQARSEGRGRGSAFIVRLPLAVQSATPGDGRTDAAAPGAQQALHVLVVDDLRDAAESLAALLQLQGHVVSVAEDGPGALELALRERPDLVLLDIGLPGQNGYDVCRRMREAGLTDTRIFAVSGFGLPEDHCLSHTAGFDAHLVKPVDPVQLLALVNRPSPWRPPRSKGSQH